MIDLNKIVNDSLIEIEESGIVKETIKKKIEKTIDDIIDDLFRSYGTFGKQIKKEIEENLQIDTNQLKIVGYNAYIAQFVKEYLDTSIMTKGMDNLKEQMDNLLTNMKSEYTLSELISLFKESVDSDDNDRIGLIIKEEGSFSYIYLDNGNNIGNNKYSYQYRIGLHDGKVFSFEYKNKPISLEMMTESFYGLKRMFVLMYASGSKIIFDKGLYEEDYDLYYDDDDNY